MTKLITVQLKAPYLILIGDITDADYAKLLLKHRKPWTGHRPMAA